MKSHVFHLQKFVLVLTVAITLSGPIEAQKPRQPSKDSADSNQATNPPGTPQDQKINNHFDTQSLKGGSVNKYLSLGKDANGKLQYTNTSDGLELVNGQLLAKGATAPYDNSSSGFSAYTLAEGSGCKAATKISDAGVGTRTSKLTKLNQAASNRNNIVIPEIKLVDPLFLKVRLNQAAQALSNLTPWSGTPITNQYGAFQGSSNTNTNLGVQLTTAGLPQNQTTYNTGQPTTVLNSYTGQCPAGYVVTGITTGNGLTCTASTATPAPTSPSTGSLNATQVTTPTPSLQTQITAPAFAAAAPVQPTPTGALAPTSTIGANPYDILSQEVELNSELLTYQALFSGLTSDNSYITPNGIVGGGRNQVTLAFPISVSPFTPYRGAVAEVRVFMVPWVAATNQSSSSPLSVINLLPASNTYNVARATTSTKQFGAGVTLDLIGVGATGGKTKSTLYLAKDTDTIALQYANPIAGLDRDAKRPSVAKFRELLPTGECDASSWSPKLNKGKDKRADEGGDGTDDGGGDGTDAGDYDVRRAIIFGWQFKPVLGNEDILPIDRLFFAQVAMDKSGTPPFLFIETRWREYDRMTGVVGQVYKNSCTWKNYGPVNPLQYASAVTYVKTDDLGGDNVRVTANGFFTDPNLQVRMSNTQRAPDYIASDMSNFEFYTTAASLVNSPSLYVISEGTSPTPLVTIPTPDKQCKLDPNKVEAEATPYSDGTATVSVHLGYGADRDTESELPLVLFGNEIYGLRNHPFLPLAASETQNARSPIFRFAVKMDALSTNQTVTVKDVNWSSDPITKRIRVGPTFTAIKSLKDSDAPTSGAKDGPALLQAGTYRVTGTGFDAICPVEIKDKNRFPCLRLDLGTGKASSLDNKHFEILNDQSARLTLDQDAKGQVSIIWINSDKQMAEWSLSTVPAPSAATAITAKPVKKGDSVSVVFSGRDFTGVSGVSFEGNALNVLDQDKKSITILVTTKVTSSAGSKDLIAIGSDGKPIVLPLVVTSQ